MIAAIAIGTFATTLVLLIGALAVELTIKG